MQLPAVLFAVFLLAAPCNAATPVGKVIELLEGLVKKGEAAKHEEQVAFAGFKQFCDDVTVEKEKAIAAGESQVEMLAADVQKYEAEIERLATEIEGHNSDIAVWKTDLAAARKAREAERSDYVMEHQDLSESVTALEMAISVLKKQEYDRPGAAALLQDVKAFARVPAAAKRAIDAFLDRNSEEPEMDVFAAPAATAYEFKSSGIIDMLEKLLDKFRDEKVATEKEEVSKRAAFDTLDQDLQNSISVATDQVESKTVQKAKDITDLATTKADLADTTAALDADKKYHADLVALCSKKSEEFASRQQLRADEIQALEKAIEILSSSAVAGAAEKHLPTMLLESRRPAVFAQLRSSDARAAEPQMRVASFLKFQADRLGSRILATLATRVQNDPFAKVKKLIEELLERLMTQATEEAEHKGWCDTELATNEHTRKTKSAAVELLRSECDELRASIAKLGEEIADLTEAIAGLNAAVAEATEIREAEKAKNEATIADAQGAQAAVTEALATLKEFYGKAAKATVLAQAGSHQQEEPYGPPPPIFEAPYKGMQAAQGGVLGMLEVIQSDFARLEAETKAAETAAQADYDTFMTDTQVDIEEKNKDLSFKKTKKLNQEGDLTEKTGELETTEQQLSTAMAYYEKLKPACQEEGQTYAERKARREDEIAALKEALRILSGDDIAALQA